MVSIRKILISSAVAATLVGALTPGAANAAAGDETSAAVGMHLVGFDAAVAKAHGYAVVTLPDGSQASVPVAKTAAARIGAFVPTAGVLRSPTAAGGVSPQSYGSTSGECGESWVQLSPRGGGSAGLTTGMSLVLDSGGPWDVHWHVDISDNGGHSTQNYGEDDGYFSGTGLSWSGKGRTLHLTKGWANATVTVGSFTITEAGWLCYSYSPTTSTTIT